MDKSKFLLVSMLALLSWIPGLAFTENATDAFLSPVEQDVLTELNIARTRPKEFAEYLVGIKQYFNGNHLERPGQVILVTEEGVAAFDEAISFLRSTNPLPALSPSRGLSLAAKAHVTDQRDGQMGHTGSDGSQPWDRMNRYGTWQGKVAENISYGGYSTRGVVIQLIVDDGVPDRGHRVNMFNPEYRFVGVACGVHARFSDMCVMDFAAGYTEEKMQDKTGP